MYIPLVKDFFCISSKMKLYNYKDITDDICGVPSYVDSGYRLKYS